MVTRCLNAVRDYLSTSPPATDVGADIRDELEFHLAERTDELIAAGQSENDARQAALARFGNPEQIAVECYAAGQAGGAIWHRLHLGLTAALVATVAVLFWQLFNSQTATATALPPPIASMIDNDWAGDVTGVVLDDHDQPIAGADVLVVVKTWPDQSYFQRSYPAKTNRNGEFRIDDVYPLNDDYEVQIAAVSEGRLLTSQYFARQSGGMKPVSFRLATSGYFAVRLQSESGMPIAGVEVFPHRRSARDGREHHVYFDSAKPIIQRTNQAGMVELPGYHPGEYGVLYVRAPHHDWETYPVTVPALGEVVTIPIRHRLSQDSEEI